MKKITPHIFKIVYFILAVLLVFLVFYKFSGKFSFPDTGWSLNKGEKIEIKPDYPIEQVFNASRSNLSKIRILFGKSNLKDGGEIKLILSSENCENPIRQDFFNRKDMQPDGYYDFVFPKIEDSKDKIYCLSIDFEPEKLVYKSFYSFTSDELSPGAKFIFVSGTGEKIEDRSLSMRPAYKNNRLWQDVEELNKRISQYKPWYFKHYYLYLVETFFILLSFLVIVSLVFIL